MEEGAGSPVPCWANLEKVFESLWRVLIVLDEGYVIVRASQNLDALAGQGAAERAIGWPVEMLVGARLFGPRDTLREALTEGRREEGRRGVLLCGDDRARLVSVTASPIFQDAMSPCDPRARFLVVLRPAEEDDGMLQSAIVSLGLARSAPMMRIVHLVETLHRSEANILITGESGTGKEVIARALHSRSPYNAGPFVAVNCAALVLALGLPSPGAEVQKTQGVYVTLLSGLEAELPAASEKAERALKETGFTLLASFGTGIPEGCRSKARTVVFSREAWAAEMLAGGPEKAFGLPLRLSLVEDASGVSVHLTNPVSIARTLYASGANRAGGLGRPALWRKMRETRIGTG